VPETGPKLDVPFGVPQMSGLATDVSTPRLKCSARLVNGCSGFSLNTVVTWPVTGLGVTSAFTRTETPYRFELATTYRM
jgi:hypothetical protein